MCSLSMKTKLWMIAFSLGINQTNPFTITIFYTKLNIFETHIHLTYIFFCFQQSIQLKTKLKCHIEFNFASITSPFMSVAIFMERHTCQKRSGLKQRQLDCSVSALPPLKICQNLMDQDHWGKELLDRSRLWSDFK